MTKNFWKDLERGPSPFTFFSLAWPLWVGKIRPKPPKMLKHHTVYDHTKLKTPYPVRFAKLSSFRRCQYWGQGWLGNPTCRTPLFFGLHSEFYIESMYYIGILYRKGHIFGFSADQFDPQRGSKKIFCGLINSERGQISRLQVVWTKNRKEFDHPRPLYF